MRTLFPILGLLLTCWSCAQGRQPACFNDADCASGLCLPNGTCAQVSSNTSDEDMNLGADLSSRADRGSPRVDRASDRGATADLAADIEADLPRDQRGADARDGGSGSDRGDGLCRPNHDGRIEAREIPTVLGLRVKFRTATNVTVDTAGTAQGNGTRLWDFSSNLPGDHDRIVEPLDYGDMWFADDFASGTYAAELRDTEDELGVYEVTDDSLLLLGVASPESGVSRTRLFHDPPVTVLSFPVEEGDSWETTSSVSGIALGLPSMFQERYRSSVDARGELTTPYGTFPVLRITVHMTRTVGFLVTNYRSVLYVSECFGTVAVAHSQDDETEPTFSDAAEISRIAP